MDILESALDGKLLIRKGVNLNFQFHLFPLSLAFRRGGANMTANHEKQRS